MILDYEYMWKMSKISMLYVISILFTLLLITGETYPATPKIITMSKRNYHPTPRKPIIRENLRWVNLIKTIVGDEKTADELKNYNAVGNENHMGDEGPTKEAYLWYPTSPVVNSKGELYFLDRQIRYVDTKGILHSLDSAMETTEIGYRATLVGFNLAIDKDDTLYLTDSQGGFGDRIFKITHEKASCIAGSVNSSNVNDDVEFINGLPARKSFFGRIEGLTVDDKGNIYFSSNGCVCIINKDGILHNFVGSCNTIGYGFFGLKIDSHGNLYYISTDENLVRKISPKGDIMAVAGNGQRGCGEDSDNAMETALDLTNSGIAVDHKNNIYIASGNCGKIWKLSTNGKLTTFAGDMGNFTVKGGVSALKVKLSGMIYMTVDKADNLIVVETDKRLIRKIYPALMSIHMDTPHFEPSLPDDLDKVAINYLK